MLTETNSICDYQKEVITKERSWLQSSFRLIVVGVLIACFITYIVAKKSVDQTFSQTEVESLDHIFRRMGSDKAKPPSPGHHGYTTIYEDLFHSLRYQDGIRVCEIGVKDGASLKAWQVYFKNHDHVYGIGYGNFQKDPSQACSSVGATRVKANKGLCTLFRGDQGDSNFLKSFAASSGGSFDIVIDDGSHLPRHQILTFEYLWSTVRPGGLYIIEDIETSYWKKGSEIYGYKLSDDKNVLFNAFRRIPDAINREFQCEKSPLSTLYDDVATVTWGHNIVILRKQLPEEEPWFNRQYRYQESSIQCRNTSKTRVHRRQ